MINFCTLFNSLYLSRALAMHASLVKTCPNFHLYIFAFDDLSHHTILQLNLQSVTVISLKEFEDEELLRIKPTRTAGEYCWTCTPSTIYYCIQKFNLASCTYIDADLLFYKDPSVLIEEMGNHSVLITDHRYTPKYDQTELYGKYCVQFITFKNDTNGNRVLNWWRNACIEWCYNRAEDGKFGDQKYLDNWQTMFEGVHELIHLGGGIAVWNIQLYDVSCINGKLFGKVKATGETFEFIFYHYHQFKYAVHKGCHLGHYDLDIPTTMLVYAPYVKALQEADQLLLTINQDHIFHEEIEVPKLKKSIRRKYLYHIKGRFRNFFKQSYILRNGACN